MIPTLISAFAALILTIAIMTADCLTEVCVRHWLIFSAMLAVMVETLVILAIIALAGLRHL